MLPTSTRPSRKPRPVRRRSRWLRIGGTHHPVEVAVVEDAARAGQELVTVAHGQGVAADLVDASAGMVEGEQHQLAVRGQLAPALALPRLLEDPFRVLDPHVRDLVEGGQGEHVFGRENGPLDGGGGGHDSPQ